MASKSMLQLFDIPAPDMDKFKQLLASDDHLGLAYQMMKGYGIHPATILALIMKERQTIISNMIKGPYYDIFINTGRFHFFRPGNIGAFKFQAFELDGDLIVGDQIIYRFSYDEYFDFGQMLKSYKRKLNSYIRANAFQIDHLINNG